MKIDHIALYTRDLEGMKAFFVKYFDAKVGEMYHNPRTAFKSYFLSFDDGSRLEIMTRPEVAGDVASIYSPGYIHMAFSVGSKADVDLLTDRLSQDGYDVFSRPRTTGDGYYESCIVGPEGNLIEITE